MEGFSSLELYEQEYYNAIRRTWRYRASATMAMTKNTKLALANVIPSTLSVDDAQSPEPAKMAGINLDKGKASTIP